MKEIKEEIFKDIPGYEGFYEVSNLGRVFSVRSNRLLKPGLSSSNYLNIKILAYVENHATSGSAGGSCSVSLKIETKDVGGAYSDTLPTQTIASAVAYDDRNQEYGIRTYEWLHTLTNDEKANGVQVKITSSCSVDAGTATTNYTEFKNVQTVLTTE